jgi:hypothetical protein
LELPSADDDEVPDKVDMAKAVRKEVLAHGWRSMQDGKDLTDLKEVSLECAV